MARGTYQEPPEWERSDNWIKDTFNYVEYQHENAGNTSYDSEFDDMDGFDFNINDYGFHAKNQWDSYENAINRIDSYDPTVMPYLIGTPENGGNFYQETGVGVSRMSNMPNTSIQTPYAHNVGNITLMEAMQLGDASHATAGMASGGGAQAFLVNFQDSFDIMQNAINDTDAFMQVQDSYLDDFSQIYGSPGQNMSEYFEKYKPEQLEAIGIGSIKEQFQAAADNIKANMARAGLSGSGIESGVLNDAKISEAEAISQQRVANTEGYYNKLMQWNMFEATSKLQLMGQRLQALGMSNSLNQTWAQLAAQEESINASNQTNVSIANAQMATQASIANANNATRVSLANAAADNSFMMQNALWQHDANRYNADIQNQAVFTNANTLNQNALYNKQAELTKLQMQNDLEIGQSTSAVGNWMQKYGIDQGVSIQQQQIDANQPDMLSQLGGLVTSGYMLYSMFSDITMKENIIKIGRNDKLGLDIYTWDWKDDSIDHPTRGFLAQEVREKYPQAVQLVGGIEMINLEVLNEQA